MCNKPWGKVRFTSAPMRHKKPGEDILPGLFFQYGGGAGN